MVDLCEARLCLLNVWARSVGHCFDMGAQVLLVLGVCFVLHVQNLRARRSCPFRFGIFLRLLDAMSAVRSVLLLGEGGHGCVDALIKGVHVWLDLLDLRHNIGLIVGV